MGASLKAAEMYGNGQALTRLTQGALMGSCMSNFMLCLCACTLLPPGFLLNQIKNRQIRPHASSFLLTKLLFSQGLFFSLRVSEVLPGYLKAFLQKAGPVQCPAAAVGVSGHQ